MSTNKSSTSIRRCRKCGIPLQEKRNGPMGEYNASIDPKSKEGLCGKCLTKRNRSCFSKNKRRF